MNISFGKYEVVGGPWSGGFGQVYKAIHADKPGKFFAVKVPHGQAGDAGLVALRRELKILSMVKHPHLVRLEEDCLDAPVPFIVLEFIAGGTLRQYVGHLRHPGIYLFLYQIAGALGSLHARGGFHRDIKPDNIFSTADGNAILGDVGLANIPTATTPLTRTIAGTPGYIDPTHSGEYDRAADIYSLGVTAAELVTGLPAAQVANGKGLLVGKDAFAKAIPSQEHLDGLHYLLAMMCRPQRAFRPGASLVQQHATVLMNGGTFPVLPQPPAPVPAPTAAAVGGVLVAGALVALLGVGLIALLEGDGGTGGPGTGS